MDEVNHLKGLNFYWPQKQPDKCLRKEVFYVEHWSDLSKFYNSAVTRPLFHTGRHNICCCCCWVLVCGFLLVNRIICKVEVKNISIGDGMSKAAGGQFHMEIHLTSTVITAARDSRYFSLCPVHFSWKAPFVILGLSTEKTLQRTAARTEQWGNVFFHSSCLNLNICIYIHL